MTEVELKGVYDHTIFCNEESGWTVGVLEDERKDKKVTVVGAFTASPGEALQLFGQWVNNKKFGEQFQVERFQASTPATIEGLRKYLGSGLIKGIGDVYADRLIARFGLEVPRVIEENPRRLLEIAGIGRTRQAKIVEGWNSQKEIKNIMLFLQSHGVGTAHAVRIYKTYKNEAIEKVSENPYRLATEITGIGFKTADRIAETLGVEKGAPSRIEAGIIYALGEISDREGHVGCPVDVLARRAAKLLEREEKEIKEVLFSFAKPFQAPVVIETGDGESWVYLRKYFEAENESAVLIAELIKAKGETPRAVLWEKFFEWYLEEFKVEFSPKQKTAIQSVYENKVSIVTGGPGTGKSTLIQAITTLFQKLNRPCVLSAPTGRAAQRMAEITGIEAKTIHRLLEFDPKFGFKRNRENQLDCDLLIVDEVSMVDQALLQKMLRAIPSTSQLMFVGDADQLPSVGSGNVLRELIQSGQTSGQIAVVRLTEVFRQAAHSSIIRTAHRINQGEFVIEKEELTQDFFFVEREEPESCVALVADLIRNRIPKKFGFDPRKDIQVLVPMNRGIVGTQNLNGVLQQTLNPSREALERGTKRFAVGDRVIQMRNNYDLEVFNGDIGFVEALDLEERTLIVRFTGKQVMYEATDLDDLELGYAITIHKSQGSEFPAVIIPIVSQHTVMIRRNLLYTAVTRGKRLVVMVGARSAVERGVREAHVEPRFTKLGARLVRELNRVKD